MTDHSPSQSSDSEETSCRDRRAEKTGVPENPSIALAEVDHTITIVPNIPKYWEVRNEDQACNYQKANFKWSINHYTRRAISEEANVDLLEGDTDKTVPYDWISDLQEDLWTFGYKSVLANNRAGTVPHSFDRSGPGVGSFDSRCAWAVRRFQIHASLPARKVGETLMSVEPTFKGTINGIVDDDTKREIAIWLHKGYKRVLQPFDPEGTFAEDHRNGLIAPRFYTLMNRDFCDECDRQDLEPYGPCWQSWDLDGYRPKHYGTTNTNGRTWHLVGLGCDVNFYSTKAVGEDWYYPVAEKLSRGNEATTEYNTWPERERIWAVARKVGLAIAVPPSKDPRHVEYHPLGNRSDDSHRWTSPPLDWFTVTKEGEQRFRFELKIPLRDAWRDAVGVELPSLNDLFPSSAYPDPF